LAEGNGNEIMKEINKLTTIAFLTAVVSASPVSVAEVLPDQPPTEQNIVNDQNGGESLSITFGRSSGGITQIAIERLDFPKAYVTVVTASGPTRDAAAMTAATLLTFTKLDPQTTFAATDSITFCYNQSKPSYVISELERTKLISPAEAEAARTALGGAR
jgi:hypothetical protein